MSTKVLPQKIVLRNATGISLNDRWVYPRDAGIKIL